jgi:hypothetical protein
MPQPWPYAGFYKTDVIVTASGIDAPLLRCINTVSINIYGINYIEYFKSSSKKLTLLDRLGPGRARRFGANVSRMTGNHVAARGHIPTRSEIPVAGNRKRLVPPA